MNSLDWLSRCFCVFFLSIFIVKRIQRRTQKWWVYSSGGKISILIQHAKFSFLAMLGQAGSLLKIYMFQIISLTLISKTIISIYYQMWKFTFTISNCFEKFGYRCGVLRLLLLDIFLAWKTRNGCYAWICMHITVLFSLWIIPFCFCLLLQFKPALQ